MYFLLKMGISQPAMLVSERVCFNPNNLQIYFLSMPWAEIRFYPQLSQIQRINWNRLDGYVGWSMTSKIETIESALLEGNTFKV